MQAYVSKVSYKCIFFNSRRSNAVAPTPASFDLKSIQCSGAKYRRDDRNAKENKRRRLNRNQIRPDDGGNTRHVTNQSIRNSQFVIDSQSDNKRYVNIDSKANVGWGIVFFVLV